MPETATGTVSLKLLVLKTLLPHLCNDDEFIAMFKDEARLSAQLIHPNVCQIFEFDRACGVGLSDQCAPSVSRLARDLHQRQDGVS